MNDRQLDRLLLAAAREVPARSDLIIGRQALLEEIMTVPTVQDDTPADVLDLGLVGERRSRREPSRVRRVRRVRRVSVALAVAATLAVGVAVPAYVLHGGDLRDLVPSVSTTDPDAPAPGLLLDEPGWKVTHVDTSGTNGSITYEQGVRSLEVTWDRAEDYEQYRDDRMDVSQPRPVTVAGRMGEEFRYQANDFTVLLKPEGATFLEVRVGGLDRAGFEAIVARLHAATTAQFEAALPSSVITPDRQPAFVARALDGVPLPLGFDASKLAGSQPRDGYQLSAHVFEQVSCAWVAEYFAAWHRGDTERVSDVRKVLRGSRHWKGMRAMSEQGAFPQTTWEYLDNLLANATKPGRAGAFEPSYRATIGCDAP